MRISEVELGNKPLTAFSQNEDFAGLDKHVLWMDHQRLQHRTFYYEVPGYSRGTGRQRVNLNYSYFYSVVLYWIRVYWFFFQYFSCVIFYLLVMAVNICVLWAAGSDGSGFPAALH